MRLRVIRIVTEGGVQFTFWFLVKSDGTEARIPVTLETDARQVETEKGQLPA